FQIGHHKVLEAQWTSMAQIKTAYDRITAETSLLQRKMNAVKSISNARGAGWARVLNDLADAVPKGVWIRKIAYEKGLLTISGSAVSKTRNEMIIANNFVATLKEKSSIRDYFFGLDVDSIQRREGSALSIADFTLKAKQR
ncbi:MAG: PilN domain-containing protein, partial [Candidatus Omnitrophica bacterium]|nr:PilN domain-containing protein [Candidatus Omnitrophota bacterium]